MTETKTLKNWADFLDVTNKLDVGPIHNTSYIYRGHSDSKWELKSSFHRIADVSQHSASDLIKMEDVLLNRFITQAHQFLPASVVSQTTDVLGWWGLMQHYGAPTRLLDWSLSPFVAAYNACIDHFDTAGSIWVLHSYSLAEKMKEVVGYKEFPTTGPNNVREFFMGENLPSTVFSFDRKIKTDRMVIQQGVFTVGQNIKDIQETIITKSLPDNKGIARLIKIVIPAELKIDFLRKLHQMNVTANSLFPGIDGLGKSTNEYLKILTAQWGHV